MVGKTQHRKLKIEKHELNLKLKMNLGSQTNPTVL
jgi:hypothetical protein